MSRRIFISIPREIGHGRDMIRGVFAYHRFREDVDLHMGALREGMPPSDWDGCILLSGRPLDSGVVTVNCSNAYEVAHADSVREDNREVGRRAGRFFLSQGYDSFLYVGIPERVYAIERGEGFREMTGSAYREQRIWGPDWSDREGNAAVLNTIRHLPKPLALFAASDGAAQHLLRILRGSGLLLPEEVAIMGVDNDDLTCLLTRPTLSSVALDGHRIGHEAARMLEERLEAPSAPFRTLRLSPGQVVERQSTGGQALRHPDVRRAMARIRSRGLEPIGVPDIVEATGLKRRALERRFQGETGESLHGALTAHRLAQARRLLEASGLSMKEIAFRCGFQSASRFSVVFRKHHGASPAEFRENVAAASRR